MYHEALRTRALFAILAVTFARVMTDTFAGISPHSVPLFVGGQLIGGAIATLFARWLLAGSPIPQDSKELLTTPTLR